MVLMLFVLMIDNRASRDDAAFKPCLFFPFPIGRPRSVSASLQEEIVRPAGLRDEAPSPEPARTRRRGGFPEAHSGSPNRRRLLDLCDGVRFAAAIHQDQLRPLRRGWYWD